MEGTTQRDGEHHDRSRVDSTVPMRDLVDSYMPAFQACVERGQVAGLMCGCETLCYRWYSLVSNSTSSLSDVCMPADNSVNGVPNCASDWLIKDVARGEWGFEGCKRLVGTGIQLASPARVSLGLSLRRCVQT